MPLAGGTVAGAGAAVAGTGARRFGAGATLAGAGARMFGAGATLARAGARRSGAGATLAGAGASLVGAGAQARVASTLFDAAPASRWSMLEPPPTRSDRADERCCSPATKPRPRKATLRLLPEFNALLGG